MFARLSRWRASVTLDVESSAPTEMTSRFSERPRQRGAHSFFQRPRTSAEVSPRTPRLYGVSSRSGWWVRPTTRETQPWPLGSPTPATREAPMNTRPTSRGPSVATWKSAEGVNSGSVLNRSVLIVVEAGQPGGQPLDGRLEFGVQVDEGAQLVGQPLEGDLFLSPAGRKLLDAAVGEVHAGEVIALGCDHLDAAHPLGTYTVHRCAEPAPAIGTGSACAARRGVLGGLGARARRARVSGGRPPRRARAARSGASCSSRWPGRPRRGARPPAADGSRRTGRGPAAG